MQCGKCGAGNRAQAKFCGECGTALAVACPHCGSAVLVGKKFCGDCGSPVAVAPITSAQVSAAGEPARHPSPASFVSPAPDRYILSHLAPRLPVKVRERIPGASALFHLLGISKGPATAYDHTMRRLRDIMTTDKEFRSSAPRTVVEFPAGSTWLAFTDLALHGAVAGQHSLDQTFLMNPAGMRDPNRSSLRILERITGRPLA